jgi:XTP/dITP diphosphohydrolase
VVSAHYAPLSEPVPPGTDREALRRLQDAANNSRLLQALQTQTDRRAMFVCTLVALRHADDPQPLVAVGRWPGEILHWPRGEHGFGYDPLMFIPELDRTVAELDAETKNRHSHRARAMAQLLGLLREAWAL